MDQTWAHAITCIHQIWWIQNRGFTNLQTNQFVMWSCRSCGEEAFWLLSKPGVHRFLHFLISNTCSTWFKPFHPPINLSLTNGALSILSQHMTVNFHRFHSFCPNISHYTTLSFDGAIFALAAATRLKAQHCTANGWTFQQALSILRNTPAPLYPGYHII
jgi:hypothetical protein